jgi:hypothetical protein
MTFDPLLVVATVKLAAYGILLTALFGNRRVVGFWGSLIPLVAGGVSSLLKKRGEKKAAAAQRQQAFEEEETGRRGAHEEKYGTPQAEAGRMSATMRLGRLLGATGGREGAPRSLVSHYESLREKPEYAARTYTPPRSGGGGSSLAASLISGAGELAKNYAAGKEYSRQKSPFSKGKGRATTPKLPGE